MSSKKRKQKQHRRAVREERIKQKDEKQITKSVATSGEKFN